MTAENEEKTPETTETEADAPATEAAAEEKPKAAKKRTVRKKAAPKAKAKAEPKAEEEAPDEETDSAEEGSSVQSPESSAKPRRRRGAAETTTTEKKRSRRPKPDAAPVFVRAQAKYVRSSPRKARLVIDHIRGKSVTEARAILGHTSRAAAEPVLKVLESAVANAEHNHELLPEELRVFQAFVDEGPTIKRYRPRALGRATKIRKRTSHITVNLTNSKA